MGACDRLMVGHRKTEPISTSGQKAVMGDCFHVLLARAWGREDERSERMIKKKKWYAGLPRDTVVHVDGRRTTSNLNTISPCGDRAPSGRRDRRLPRMLVGSRWRPCSTTTEKGEKTRQMQSRQRTAGGEGELLSRKKKRGGKPKTINLDTWRKRRDLQKLDGECR